MSSLSRAFGQPRVIVLVLGDSALVVGSPRSMGGAFLRLSRQVVGYSVCSARWLFSASLIAQPRRWMS